MAQFREDLAYVRRIVEDSRAAMRIDMLPLLVWGGLTVIGVTLAYAFDSVDSPWLWAVLVGVAWLYTARRASRGRSEARLFAHRVLGTTWFAVLTSMTLIGFVGAFSGVLPTQAITPVLASLFGVGYLASAILIDRRALAWLAASWWVGSVVLFFLPGALRLLVFGLLVAALLMVPALLMHRGAHSR